MAKSFASSFNSLNIIIKFLLTFFLDWIFGTIYRASRGHIIAAVVWFFTGGLFGIGWIIDIITILLSGKYTLFA